MIVKYWKGGSFVPSMQQIDGFLGLSRALKGQQWEGWQDDAISDDWMFFKISCDRPRIDSERLTGEARLQSILNRASIAPLTHFRLITDSAPASKLK